MMLLLVASLIAIKVPNPGATELWISASDAERVDLDDRLPDATLETPDPVHVPVDESDRPDPWQINDSDTQLEIQQLTDERDFDKEDDSQDRTVTRKTNEPAASKDPRQDAVPCQAEDSLGEALHELTKDILGLLETNEKVRVVWCFDRSASMEESRQTISDQIEIVYGELENFPENRVLTTAVASFAGQFYDDLKGPTQDHQTIIDAIRNVPTNRSGDENFCSAVIRSVDRYMRGAGLLVLIMVTDESGEKADERANLAEALKRTSRNVRLYVLGREAVFGQRKQLIEIPDPAPNENEFSPVDRGPESCYVEQLQHSPFEKLEYTYSSGYGPYAQSMLVQHTGGKFYLIPDTLKGRSIHRERNFKNKDLVGYAPEMVLNDEYRSRVSRSTFRSAIAGLIGDIHREAAHGIEDEEGDSVQYLPLTFELPHLEDAFEDAFNNADQWLSELALAQASLDHVYSAREKETSRRWVANYDLLRAQLAIDRIRVQEYRGLMQQSIRTPPRSVAVDRDGKKFQNYSIFFSKSDTVLYTTEAEVERAKKLVDTVTENHPETPWAYRIHREWNEVGLATRLGATHGPSVRGREKRQRQL